MPLLERRVEPALENLRLFEGRFSPCPANDLSRIRAVGNVRHVEGAACSCGRVHPRPDKPERTPFSSIPVRGSDSGFVGDQKRPAVQHQVGFECRSDRPL